MEIETFNISKDTRENFYEVMEKTFGRLESKVNAVEMRLLLLDREVEQLKKTQFGEIEGSNFFTLGFRPRFTSFRQQTVEQKIDIQIINRVYKPLALSSAFASTVLAVSSALVASPILAVPFLLFASFSIYYWHLQNRKLKS